jgi:hypothetical protein
MPRKRFLRWMVVLAAFAPIGCQSFCDRWAPCHPAAGGYAAYPAGPCCPPPCNPCCAPAGYPPTNAYQQGSWTAPQPVPQTRLSPNCCE